VFVFQPATQIADDMPANRSTYGRLRVGRLGLTERKLIGALTVAIGAGTIGSMTTTLDDVRPLTLEDLEWVLQVGGHRRERIEGYAPCLWRPAPDARMRHNEFLADQIQNPQVVSVRTDHGFAFAARRGEEFHVDDMALDDDHLWPHDGSALLKAVSQRNDLRFVCPIPEPERRQTAIHLGMIFVESWWHRDLATEIQRR